MKLNIFGLSLEYTGGTLYSDDNPVKPDIRTLGQMKKVLFDPEAGKGDSSTPLYHMYRDLAPKLKIDGFRYDVTIILPMNLGTEFNKTLGHYHPQAVAGLSYTELYNVLEGEAHYLLQRKGLEGVIDDAILIKAKKGDAVPMPPNYGHITINPGKEPLIMSNLVFPDFSSEYKEYEKNRGGAYYELSNGKIVPNPAYGKLPEIKVSNGSSWNGLGPDILASFYKDQGKFEFLKDPREYKE
ncbi:MAG: glucose-6-phosphate isomerase family protein [Candidatus Micrarchaeota archaeon]